MSRMASQRRSVAASAANGRLSPLGESGRTCPPAKSDAAIATVAAATAASRSLFFMKARSTSTSVPKGILLRPACQLACAREGPRPGPGTRGTEVADGTGKRQGEWKLLTRQGAVLQPVFEQSI